MGLTNKRIKSDFQKVKHGDPASNKGDDEDSCDATVALPDDPRTNGEDGFCNECSDAEKDLIADEEKSVVVMEKHTYILLF